MGTIAELLNAGWLVPTWRMSRTARLIESNYENHCGGALRRLNAITEQLESLACMAFGDGKPTAMLAQALARDFGSVDRWRSEFVAMAKSLAGGSGWVLLVYAPRDRRLIHQYAGGRSQPDRSRGHPDPGTSVQIIDARPRSYISCQQDIMDGAVWRDSERVHDWIGQLSKSDPVVVFCAYGFHVGRKTAIALREAGFDAKYMKGGHSAWKTIGGPLKLYT